MLIDILQELYDALREQDVEKAETAFSALNKLGMDRETAVQILKAGEKYFKRKYVDEEASDDSVSEINDEDL